MSSVHNTAGRLLATIRLHPYYSIMAGTLAVFSFFYFGKLMVFDTPIPPFRDWAYTMRDDLFFLSATERKTLNAYMQRHYAYYLPSGITVGDAINREKEYIAAQKKKAIQQKIDQEEAVKIAAEKSKEEATIAAENAKEEENNQKNIDKIVGFNLKFVWPSGDVNKNKMVYLSVINHSKLDLSSARLFLTFYNSLGKTIFSEYIDMEAEIPPAKKFTGIFYPCGAAAISASSQCQYFNSANVSYVINRVAVTVPGKAPLVGIYGKAASTWTGAALLISNITNKNIQSDISKAQNYLYNQNQSSAAQINDWDQAAQNYGAIERLRDGQ